jgi:glycosyltransferase involved in cell wall biosynthesis
MSAESSDSQSARVTGAPRLAGLPGTDEPVLAPGRKRSPGGRPSVGVLVDLELTPSAGGHVKFWRNIASAAARHGCEFDLTLHFQGDVERHTVLADHVHLVTMPPAFSTARLSFLRENPDHTDIAPHHRRLAARLASYDVIHTTDAYFAYARTALRRHDPRRQALVTSVHTDTPAYTRIYAERAYRNLFRNGRIARWAVERRQWPESAERRMREALVQHMEAARHVWIAPNDDPEKFPELRDRGALGVLRRGIDWSTFSPDRRDRGRLTAELGIAADEFVLTFAGRIDRGKEVMVAANAVRALLDRGRKATLILAGRGHDAEAIRSLLGPAVRLPGFVEQHELGWILASSDAFVFPSRIETAASAVIEARASGLPALVTPSGAGKLIREDWADGVVVHSQAPGDWADAIEQLIRDRDLTRKMGGLANEVTAQTQPSWHEVLTNDLAPGWLRSLSGGHGSR